MKRWEPEDLETGFEESWKRWAGRAPRTSPEEAAVTVRRRIGLRATVRRRRRLWVAAAAIVLAVSGIVLVRVPNGPEPGRVRMPARQPVPLGEGQVLFWIDDKTPLYMTLRSPEP